MENSQLIIALRSLNKNEFKQFGRFVHSPYFNNRSEAVRFYDAIKKYYPDFDSVLDERSVFAEVYHGKKFSKVLMRKLVSISLNLFLDFITENKFRNVKLEYDFKQIEALHEKRLFALHRKKLDEYNKMLNNSKETMEVYEYIYKVENEMRLLYEQSGEKGKLSAAEKPIEKLYNYFFTVLLNEYLQILALKKGRGKLFDHTVINEIIKQIKKGDYKKFPLIYAYYLMVMVYKTNDERYFYELTEFRKVNSERLEKTHNVNMLIVMIDYSIYNINKGLLQFRNELFDLSKEMVNEDLLDPNSIDPATFVNIVQNSSYIVELDWTEMFINKYKKGIDPNVSSSIISYSMGLVEFYKNNFGRSLEYLSVANLKWRFMKFDIKRLILCNCYELGYYDELLLQIDSYKHYLKSEKEMMEGVKTRNKLFIDFFSELLNCKLKNDDVKLLIKNVERSPYFYRKEWILQRAELIK